MSRADYGYGGGRGGGRGGERWDSERFAVERDRARFEERDSRFSRTEDFGRTRERSVDEIYERRGPRGYEEDRYERRDYYEDDRDFNRYAPAPEKRDTRLSVTIEKEPERERGRGRDYDEPPKRASNRPAFLRRQSSLDTFDRKPLTRYVDREEYGPPARYRPEVRPPPIAPLTPIPLPRSRGLPPPRRYERESYEEIEIAEPDHYGDERYRAYPERVREREIIRKKKRSGSRESRRSHSHSRHGSVRASSVSSSSSEATTISVRNEFPKKGKTRMPARLVSKRAIIDLGYPFEEEGDTIIIMKALGRENIDEVIKLSEDYKSHEIAMHGGRSEAGTIIEERHEVFTIPPPPQPPQMHHAPPPPPPAPVQIVEETKIIEHSPHHHHHHPPGGPIIMDAVPREETFIERREVYEHSEPGALVRMPSRAKDERAIRAEIKALEAEKEALRAEKRAEKEMRKADRIRREGRAEGELVLYERDRFETGTEEITMVRRERIEEPEGGVRIEKDKKGRMAISVPKYYR